MNGQNSCHFPYRMHCSAELGITIRRGEKAFHKRSDIY